MTARELALRMLRDAGDRGVTTREFLEAGVGSRFGARLQEIRDAGQPITAEHLRHGSYRYRLADIGGGGDTRGSDRALPVAVAASAEMCWHRDYTDPNGEWAYIPLSEAFPVEQLRLAA